MSVAGIWRTTAFRYAAIYTALFCLAGGIGLGAVYQATIGVIERQTRTTIAAEVQGLSEQFRSGGLRQLAATIRDRSRAQPGSNTVYILADPGLTRVAGNLSAWPDAARQDGWIGFPLIRVENGQEVSRRALAETFTLPGGYHLLVGRDTEELARYRANFADVVLRVALAMLVFGMVTGIVLSRRVLARVAAAAAAGERIAAGNLEERLPVGRGGDEFDRLAQSVNGMVERIEALMSGMRIATDSISHDIRRPLTRLRARLELALREADPGTTETLAGAIEEIDATVRILENLLQIARAEAALPGEALRPGDLAEIAHGAAELYRPHAEDCGIALTVDAAPVTVRCERQLLAQAVANLIDNALKHAPHHTGVVTVSVAPLPGGAARLAVCDNGPGIPAPDRTRVTERFVRLDSSRKTEGAGLGLSLVQAVVHLHRGRLALSDNAPGLCVEIVLPRIDAD